MRNSCWNQKVKQTWENIWKTHNDNRIIAIFEKLFYKLFPIQFSSKTILNEIVKTINSAGLTRFSVIECGCGSGYIQKEIFKKYGNDAYFLDISPEALKYAKNNIKDAFDKNKHHFIEGDALDMNIIRDESFDITWNAGVIEHFHETDQRKMVAEMLRITKKNGYVLIFAPSTFGKIYLKMKTRAEKLNIWQAGYEQPLESLKHLIPKQDITNYKEYSTGFISQLHYLKYLFKNKLSQYIAIAVLEIVQRILYFLEWRRGYFIVGLIKK